MPSWLGCFGNCAIMICVFYAVVLDRWDCSLNGLNLLNCILMSFLTSADS